MGSCRWWNCCWRSQGSGRSSSLVESLIKLWLSRNRGPLTLPVDDMSVPPATEQYSPDTGSASGVLDRGVEAAVSGGDLDIAGSATVVGI